MEAAVVNLVPQGGKAIVLHSGKFAERWRKICEAFGIQVVRYEAPWGASFDTAEVARLLQEHPDAVAVFATLLETSTGVGHDVEAIACIANDAEGLNEAVGTLFTLATGLDPLTPLALPASSSVAAATRPAGQQATGEGKK